MDNKKFIHDQINMMLAKKYSQPMTPQERIKGGASALPIIGDAISGYDAYQSAKQGDYLDAVLNAIGALPIVPGLAGIINNPGKSSINKWIRGSKVVNPDGTPMVVYHGTNSTFDKFKTNASEMGAHFGPLQQANQFASNFDGGNVRPSFLNIKNPLRMNDSGGFYPLDVARELLDRNLLTQQDYIKVYNLLDNYKDNKAISHIQKRLIEQGYDGIVYLNKHEGLDHETTKKILQIQHSKKAGMTDGDFLKIAPNAKDSFIAFMNKQIKPAIGYKK